MTDCLFCKICAGDIPANKLYEDDDILAFWDISPQAPKHFLVIPRKHIENAGSIQQEDEQVIGKMISKAAALAVEHGMDNGCRMVINNGADAGQEVFHIHMHVLGGRRMGWPPG